MEWSVRYTTDGADHLERAETPQAAIELACRLMNGGADVFGMAWVSRPLRSGETKLHGFIGSGSGGCDRTSFSRGGISKLSRVGPRPAAMLEPMPPRAGDTAARGECPQLCHVAVRGVLQGSATP